jgi:uncharacterized membrane protein
MITLSKPGPRRTGLVNASSLSLVIAVLLTGLSAGFFATYQYPVIRALATVSDSTYVTAFQAINANVRSVEFGVIFFGSLPAILLAALFSWHVHAVRLLLLTAAAAYAVLLAITFAVHIPLNEALSTANAATESASARQHFETRWNEMHLYRTLAVCVSFTLSVTALLLAASCTNNNDNNGACAYGKAVER